MSRAQATWVALAVVAGAFAVLALSRWAWAVSLGGPVLYGEGAVAHAAVLARDGLAYVAGASVAEADPRPVFTAANYPPLYFLVAGLGEPFVAGRLVSVAATLFVAGAIAWRARAAGRLAAFALAAAWLATVPVMVWGPAVKPDLLALALAVAAVVVAGAGPRRALAAGALFALACWAKPTEALPALAVAVWCARAGPRTFAAFAGAGAVGVALPLAAAGGSGAAAMVVHVVSWNALPWTVGQAGLLAVVGLATLLVPLAAASAVRGPGPLAAYAVGAVGVVALGGREGSTINYLLDLSAAAALLVASAAPRLRQAAVYPLAAAAQLLVAVALLDPFAVLPGRAPATGAWGDPARIGAARSLPPGPALVEDSGLLVAVGREPIVDDLFLWSRLRSRELEGSLSFPEGQRLLDAVASRTFATVAAEADLAALDAAPAYERARWHPDLVAAILASYRLDHRSGALWIYLPR